MALSEAKIRNLKSHHFNLGGYQADHTTTFQMNHDKTAKIADFKTVKETKNMTKTNFILGTNASNYDTSSNAHRN